MMSRRTVVITGGGTGIGAACARRFAADGARVFVLGRRREPLEAVARACGAQALPGDVSDGAWWRDELLPAILSGNDRIDALIACAGGMGIGKIADLSDEQWRQALESNLNSAFAAVRACLPALTASRGNIVLVGSIASLAAGPEACGYVTAKHALLGLMRSVARDYGPQGVRCNAVCPGWVVTPMADEEMRPLMARHGLTLEQAYQWACRDVPLRRPARAEEIAAVCHFLASSAASAVTGAALTADGGATVVDVPTLAFDQP